MKKCNKCGEIKPQSEFHKKKTNKDGLQHYCKPCRVVENNYQYTKNKDKRLDWQKSYYENNKENRISYNKFWRKNNIEHSANYDLVRKCGITLSEKFEMITFQKGCCAICNTKFKNNKSAHVDHCHTTGKVRSILCSHCNTALGLLKESPDILKSALKYLAKHNKKDNKNTTNFALI